MTSQSHLDKSKGALEHIKASGLEPGQLQYADLLTLAQVQANIASAEALARIATALEKLCKSQTNS